MYYVKDINIRHGDFLPDGHPELMVTSLPLSVSTNTTQIIRSTDVLLWGQIRFFGEIKTTAAYEMCGIKFQPWLLYDLSKRSPASLVDDIIDGRLLFSERFIASVKQLAHINWGSNQQKENISKMITMLFLDEFDNNIQIKYNFINTVKQIKHDSGVHKVAQLLPYYKQSFRTLEHDFTKYIGISPKEYQNIVRLRKASIDLKNGKNILSTALDLGYYDHAHFTKDFKRFSQKSPKQFLGQRNLVICHI